MYKSNALSACFSSSQKNFVFSGALHIGPPPLGADRPPFVPSGHFPRVTGKSSLKQVSGTVGSRAGQVGIDLFGHHELSDEQKRRLSG